MREPLVAAARQAGDMSIELQVQQHHGKRIGRQAAPSGEIVESARIETHVREQIVVPGRAHRLLRTRHSGFGEATPAQLFKHVLRGLDELGALLDQLVTAA